MRARHIAMAACLFSAAAVLPGACLLPEIGISEGEPAPDAGPDAGADADADGPVTTACMRTTYPPPPDPGDGVSVDPIVVALRSIYMGDGADPLPGFDLDFTCTCFEGAGETCTTKNAKPQCDGEGDGQGGVDNAAALLFQLVVDNLGSGYFGSKYYSESAELGGWSLLIRLSDYNGAPNDPAVTVSLFVSPGLEAGMVPVWDGTDAWPISADSVGPAGDVSDPLYVSNGGYVAGGVLVATLPSATIRFSGGASTISVRLRGGVLSGRLVFDAAGARLTEGVLAGRWSEEDVFASLSTFRGQGGLLICTNSLYYQPVKSRVCSARDILTDAILPASTPCDALSIGIGFEADPAQLGPVVPAAEPTPGCPPESDPVNDFCK